jgi:carboxyvinyl-carboxyphosphonate phosphorylmutase
MNIHERREQLRSILRGERLVRPASVYDPLSARAAEALGYELMMMAGSTASLAVLGAPDLMLLSLTELAEQVRRVTRAASLPLLVDADHGYGNALNVSRCVEELETAGVSALSIEDTVLPRPFGASADLFLPVEEGVGKMRAALAARSDPNLVILARTGAARGEGLTSAIQRARAYEAVGVDGLFFVGMRAQADIEALRAVSSLPFVLGGSTGQLHTDAYLASQGVRICGWSHQPIEAAAQAMYDTMRAHREQAGGDDVPRPLASDELMAHLSRQQDYDEAIARYLR